MFDFKVIERAGITQQQFADLVGVSRVTVYTWMQNRFKPRPAMRVRVRQALKLLSDAVADDSLPIQKINHKEHVDSQLAKIHQALHERA